MRLMGLISAVYLVLGVLPARAADLPVSAFFGTWQGNGVAENADSLYFAMTTRDFDVVIEQAGNGFKITWTTVIRSGGDPNNPDVRRREASLTFEPSGRFSVFEASESGDPLQVSAELGPHRREDAQCLSNDVDRRRRVRVDELRPDAHRAGHGIVLPTAA